MFSSRCFGARTRIKRRQIIAPCCACIALYCKRYYFVSTFLGCAAHDRACFGSARRAALPMQLQVELAREGQQQRRGRGSAGRGPLPPARLERASKVGQSCCLDDHDIQSRQAFPPDIFQHINIRKLCRRLPWALQR